MLMGPELQLLAENQRKLSECKGHRFSTGKMTAAEIRSAIGLQVPCLKCGGLMRLSRVADYLAGYVAAGGKATDVLIEYDDPC